MKKLLLIFTAIIVLLLSACAVVTDKVILSLGSYESKEYYTSGGFQDYTDYAKYTYKNINVEQNKYFKRIDDLNQWNLILHIENFEEWIDAIKDSDPENEVVVAYDFDMSLISNADYYYIDKEPDSGYENYDVYLIDS